MAYQSTDNGRRRDWISFLPAAAVALALATISAGEPSGWPASLYTSPWMCALWTLAALSTLTLLLRRHVWRRGFTFMIHISLLLILAGALCTHLTAKEGTVHLRNGVAPEWAPRETSRPDIRLESFRIDTYPGTSTPMDFKTTLTWPGAEETTAIRLNGAATIGGYKLIQESFDSDGGGVTLHYTYDPAGRLLTYSAYILIFLSLAGFFLERRSGFRIALRQLRSLRRLPVALLPLLACATADGAEIPHSTSEKLMRLMVVTRDRVAPLAALAADFTSTVTGGATTFGGRDPERIFADFLFDFGSVKGERMIRVKDATLKTMLGIDGKYASYDDYMRAIMSGALDIDNPETASRYASDLARFEAVNMLVSGELLKIFPVASGSNVEWYSPVSDLPEEVRGDEWVFIRKGMGVLNEAILTRDYSGAEAFLDGLHRRQVKASGIDIPMWRVRLESIYSRVGGSPWLFIWCLATGAALSAAGCLRRRQMHNDGIVGNVLTVCASIALAALSTLIAARWILAGHVPLSNGFETMQFMGWCLLAGAVAASRRSPLIGSLALAGAALPLAVACMGSSAGSIGSLMPVLSSPLLSLHVVLVMGAYSLLLLAALCGIVALAGGKSRRMAMMWTERALLYPAVALLAAGIFVGAIWADVSWGTFWSWDPKETWALITMIAYSIPLHGASLRWATRPRQLSIYCIAAFITVLVTYFGVNFYLGGMHSYA